MSDFDNTQDETFAFALGAPDEPIEISENAGPEVIQRHPDFDVVEIKPEDFTPEMIYNYLAGAQLDAPVDLTTQNALTFDELSVGDIDTCIRIIGKYDVNHELRSAALVAAATESFAQWANDFGVIFEGCTIVVGEHDAMSVSDDGTEIVAIATEYVDAPDATETPS